MVRDTALAGLWHLFKHIGFNVLCPGSYVYFYKAITYTNIDNFFGQIEF